MALAASTIILFFTLMSRSCKADCNKAGPILLTDYNCSYPGQNASYICTACGEGITVWGGTAFNCADMNDQISLRHSLFEGTGAMRECNNGAIVGYSIRNGENSFTSRLDVRLSADLQGQTVTCSVDDGAVTLIGNTTLNVSTPPEVPPPPERPRVSIPISSPQGLIFSWDEVECACSALQYDFTSENCGSCTMVMPRVVNCTGFQTSTAGITCMFTVWSVVCGNVTGPGSMQSATVNLKVPNAPTDVQTLPRYMYQPKDGCQTLIGLMTTFPTVAPAYNISSGSGIIDGSVKDYTITYLDITFGTICGTASIPASSCVSGTCTHNFDVTPSTWQCPPSTTIIVKVSTSNVLGRGPPSTPVIREGINNLVNVNFDVTMNRRNITMSCNFLLNQPPNIVKRCSANITYGEDCDRFLGNLTGMGTGDNVTTQPLETKPGVIEYCILVTAETNNVTVLVDGKLNYIRPNSQENLRAAVVIPLVITSLTIILLWL